MANFPTHIAVGTVVSGALATATLAANVVAPENLVAVTLAGVLGSVLPDIDLKESRPSRAMFAGLAVFFSFAVLSYEPKSESYFGQKTWARLSLSDSCSRRDPTDCMLTSPDGFPSGLRGTQRNRLRPAMPPSAKCDRGCG